MSPDVYIITKLLADKSRMQILDVLMDGSAHTVKEIASYTHVKQHTISYHLKRLKTANLVKVQSYGKFRYYSIKDTSVITILETLSLISPERPVQSYRQHFRKKALKKARTCYDHLAGELGVAITESFLSLGLLKETDTDYHLTPKGHDYFTEKLQFDIETLYRQKRRFCIKCLDWSERQNHMAGSLGKAVLNFLISQKIVERGEGARELLITDYGKEFLEKQWSLAITTD